MIARRLAPQELRTFFITFVTAERRSLFRVERNAALLLDVFCSDRTKGRYQLDAWVVMPDHVHLLLTPAEDVRLEKAVQFIKGGFSFQLKAAGAVWQKGYREHRIRDAADFERHVIYIDNNPTRAALEDGYTWTHRMHPGLYDPSPEHFCTQGHA